MKTTPSTQVVAVRNERGKAIRATRLTIGDWEEEAFDVSVRVPAVVTPFDSGWDNIEAIGAADDASRFRIDSPTDEELTGSCP